MIVILVVLGTLAGGIALDAQGPAWGQLAVVCWTWTVLAWIAYRSDATFRRELLACIILATCGELFLMDVWGLYEYRLGNLPLFIPAGHAIVFAASVRLSAMSPRWLPGVVVVTVGTYLAVAGWRGTDTQGAVWFAAFLAYLVWSADRQLCATLFVFALLIETYGTSLGGWRYFMVEPWFGLTTTNPPVWVGAVYCTLETLVRALAPRLPGNSTGRSRRSGRKSFLPDLPDLPVSLSTHAELASRFSRR